MAKYEYFQPCGTTLFPQSVDEMLREPYKKVFDGEVEWDSVEGLEGSASRLFGLHNRDDRPRRKEIMSMSIGAVIVFDGQFLVACMPLGWAWIITHDLVKKDDDTYEWVVRV